MAVTNTAYASLWRYCFDIDLRTETVAAGPPCGRSDSLDFGRPP